MPRDVPTKDRKFICGTCKQMDAPLAAHKCQECKKLKAKDWYQKNKGKYLTWQRSWRNENRERWRELHRISSKIYSKKYPEKKLSAKRIWRSKHREELLPKKREYVSKYKYGEFGSAHRALIQLTRELRKLKEGQNEIEQTDS